jgi:DNA-binding response OmpR family regulator
LDSVLIVACEEMGAALLGLMVEVSGFQARFVPNDQPAAAAIPAQRPFAVLVDCDHPEFKKDLIDVIKASGARPVIFSPSRSRGEMKDLGSRHGTQSITLSAGAESFAQALTA